MKKTVLLILKIVVLTILVAWMVLLVIDYFRGRDRMKPIICLSETTTTKGSNSYYQCNSFGYKYYEYTKDGYVHYGFGAIFIPSEAEKEMSESNE